MTEPTLFDQPRKHRTHRMHANSLDARGDTSQRRIDVLACYTQPRTDRDVMRMLGFTDMNKIRPRITELVDAGALREVGTIKDDTTGRHVRLVARSES